MDSYEPFPNGSKVTYVGHQSHAAPPVLAGMDGRVHGEVEGRAGLGLYWVNVVINENKVRVQLHEDQIKHRKDDGAAD